MKSNRYTLVLATIGLFCFVGCGDVPKSGNAARANSPPKPAAPDPEDHSPPPTPESIAATRLGIHPDAGASTQTPAGQNPAPTQTTAVPTNPAQASPAQSNPAPQTAPSDTAPAVASGIPGGRRRTPNVGPPPANGSATSPAQPNVSSPPDATASPAQVGVGAQGKGYGNGDAGLVTTPISAYFSAREMIVFNIQIPNAMNTFKAFNNRLPNSQAEFEKEILEPSNIKLPELPAGKKYLYDPAKGELMVVGPAPK